MTITPASAFKARTANAVTGVGPASGNFTAFPPAAATTSATAWANWAEPWRASQPTTTLGASTCWFSQAISPAVARTTTASFMRAHPGPSRPRNPAVPNCSGPAKASWSSPTAALLPARASSRVCSSWAFVTGSGSWRAQSAAWPSRSITGPFRPGFLPRPIAPTG